MKVEWEPADIVCGQRVGSPKRSEQWIIGYVNGGIGDGSSYALISLEDGMVAYTGTAAGLAERLNSSGEAPVELIERPRRPRD